MLEGRLCWLSGAWEVVWEQWGLQDRLRLDVVAVDDDLCGLRRLSGKFDEAEIGEGGESAEEHPHDCREEAVEGCFLHGCGVGGVVVSAMLVFCDLIPPEGVVLCVGGLLL
jgi:hypothetical protein